MPSTAENVVVEGKVNCKNNAVTNNETDSAHLKMVLIELTK